MMVDNWPSATGKVTDVWTLPTSPQRLAALMVGKTMYAEGEVLSQG